MWWLLLAALRDHLAAILNPMPVEPTCTLIIGGDGSIPIEPTIILKRGPESTRNWTDPWSGVQLLYLECWAYDSDDPEQAYADLAILEAEIIKGLAKPIELVGYALLTRITAIDPDGDAFRPSVGCQMTIEIQWQKVT